MSEALNLFSPELDALIANHNRAPDNYVTQPFPYDQKTEICEWLRRHGLNDLAEGVEECEPMTVGMYIAGYRFGYKREKSLIDAIVGSAT